MVKMSTIPKVQTDLMQSIKIPMPFYLKNKTKKSSDLYETTKDPKQPKQS